MCSLVEVTSTGIVGYVCDEIALKWFRQPGRPDGSCKFTLTGLPEEPWLKFQANHYLQPRFMCTTVSLCKTLMGRGNSKFDTYECESNYGDAPEVIDDVIQHLLKIREVYEGGFMMNAARVLFT